MFERVPEDLGLDKPNPNDADDAGPLCKHHQHHVELVSRSGESGMPHGALFTLPALPTSGHSTVNGLN